MKKYDILIANLFANCKTNDYPNEPVLIDTGAMSNFLEKVFIEEGLMGG